jgi:hypothetical protein
MNGERKTLDELTTFLLLNGCLPRRMTQEVYESAVAQGVIVLDEEVLKPSNRRKMSSRKTTDRSGAC